MRLQKLSRTLNVNTEHGDLSTPPVHLYRRNCNFTTCDQFVENLCSKLLSGGDVSVMQSQLTCL